jgi:hypothetical protein
MTSGIIDCMGYGLLSIGSFAVISKLLKKEFDFGSEV